MQITSSSPCPGHLRSPGVGGLEGGRCWTSHRGVRFCPWGQNRKEPLNDGVTSFSKCAPKTLVTSVFYLLSEESEAEGGVCKSSSLAPMN